MNRYNPNIHHRRSIRLKGYDYSQAGLYFITICVKNRKCLFGNIDNGKMNRNDAGKMIEKLWNEIPNDFKYTKLHEYIIMPNHFHGIIEIVGADSISAPNTDSISAPNTDSAKWAEMDSAPTGTEMGTGIKTTIPNIIQSFKRYTTIKYIRGVKNNKWKPFDGKLWQRNYWEHIIRNENEYNRISQYIINNPAKWQNDKLKGGNGNIVKEPSAEYNSEIWMI